MKKFLIVSTSAILVLVLILFICSILLFPVKYKEEIIANSQKYNLPPKLVASVINVESGYNKDAVSKVGAKGLMQIMPATANEIATKLNIETYDILNEPTNIEFGCYYLSYLLSRYNNNLVLALASYNAGLNNVDNWIKNDEYFVDNTLIRIPFKETENYIKKINFNLIIYGLKYR